MTSEYVTWRRTTSASHVSERLASRIEFLNDPALKKNCIEDRPFLKSFGLTPEGPEPVIFRLGKGQVYFWTMKDNLKP